MRRLPGQAVRVTGAFLHRAVTLVLLIGLAGSVVVAGVAWRLAQGPLDLPWLAKRMEAAANADSGNVKISIGSAALTWEGFRLGVDRPLDIRLSNVAATDPSRGHSVVVPQIDVSLALGGLLQGRIQPRALEIDSARLVLLRTQSGDIRLDFGGPDEAVPESGPSELGGLIAELARPAAAAGNVDRLGRFSQLRRIRIRNSTLTLIDRQLAVLWRAEAPEIDLRRQAQGGVEGQGSFNLAMGAERASVHVAGTLAAGDGSIKLSAQLADLAPAALARQTGALERLEVLDARVNGSLNLDIGPHQVLQHLALDLHAGPGKLKIGPSVVLLAGADLAAEGTDSDLLLDAFSLRVVAHDGGPVSKIGVSGAVHRAAGRLKSELSVTVDRVAFADLGQLWPVPIATKARAWITENIVAGSVRDGHAQVTVEANEDFSGPALTAATGSLLGDGVTVYWLRPVPPIDRGTVRLNILDPDTLEILVNSARQSLDGHESGMLIKSGKMRVTGIIHKDQVGYIDSDVAGPVADAVALLRNKKLHLLDRFPMDANGASGQVSGTLAVTVPFESNLVIEQVGILAKMHLQDTHLPGLVAGRDVDHGNADLVASTEGLKLNGQAEISAISTQVQGEMNFRPGPPTQVVRKIVATGRASSRQLAAAGLDAGEALDGNLTLKATVTERRDGSGDILVDADLLQAGLLVAPIGWQKEAGQPATGQARLHLRHGHLAEIEGIALDGPGQGDATLLLRAGAAFVDGHITDLAIDRMTLGRTSGHGTVRFPAAAPIQMSIDGSSLDLSQVLSSKRKPDTRREAEDSKGGPSWVLDARFDHALMANAQTVSGLVAHAENDGKVMRSLHVGARLHDAEQGMAEARFRLDIAAPAGSSTRTLSAATDDAGDLLRAVDILHTMQGGRLSVNGVYDDALGYHPLSGTAEITDFRIQGAPALGRLLQAMTLYGLVDVLQGPGLGFSRLVAPFRLTRDELGLTDARAYSSSLGLTVKGRIDLARDRMDLEGTIVPAYFFNSLLGNLPVIGKIFSPEEGGGLFAASYTIKGSANDPAVMVNPLSALTPGFLRGVFGLF